MQRSHPTPCAHFPALRRAGASALLCLLLGVLASHPAQADDKPGANKALRRAQLEAMKAQQEKAEVEAQKNALAEQLDKVQAAAKKTESGEKAARGELAALRRALADAKTHAEALQAQDEAHTQQAREQLTQTVNDANARFDRYEADIATLRQRLAEAEAQDRTLAQQVQALESDKARLTGDLGERGESLASCEKKNGDLFQLNALLREKYRDKGLLGLLRSGEPVTGLGRVKEENELQDIEDRAYDARINTAAH